MSIGILKGDVNKMEIDYFAFSGCRSLESVTITEGVTYIGNSTFKDCDSLKSIAIGDNVRRIGKSAFQNCTSLENVTIGNGVKTIGRSAFENCTSIAKITIPNSVISINNQAFQGCTSLKSITIPKSVKSIGGFAFGYYHNNGFLTCGRFTIYGYVGTAAEEYADENLLKFVALEDKHVHTFSDWTVTTPATCTADGVEKRTCTVCGEEETRKTAKTDHSLTHVEEKSTCTVAGVSYDICGECSATFNYTVLPLSAHSFSAWATTKKPTDSEAGEETRTCTVCGFEEKREIKQLEPSDGKDDETKFSISKLLYKIELFLKKLFDLIKSVGVA